MSPSVLFVDNIFLYPFISFGFVVYFSPIPPSAISCVAISSPVALSKYFTITVPFSLSNFTTTSISS